MRSRATRAVAAALAACAGCTYDWGAFRRGRDAMAAVDQGELDATDERAGPDVAPADEGPPPRDVVDAGVDVADARRDAADVVDAADARADVVDVLDARVDAGTDAGVDVVDVVDVVDGTDVADVADVADAADAMCRAPTMPFDAGAGCTAVLRVNEFQVSGPRGAADEFVEIYNAGACDVSLAGWTVRYASAMGTGTTTLWTGVAGDGIPARGYFLLAGQGFACPAADTFGSSTGALAAAGGAVGIFPPGAAMPMDSAGYGNATNALVEGTAAPVHGAAQSLARVPNGVDTNDNRADFQSRAPTPGAAN